MADFDRNTLSMLDEHGHRKFIIPAEVKGAWAKKKALVQSILLVIFLVLPWVRISGQQALLLDISARHFVFFGLEFFAHDAPIIFLLVFIFFISILLVTALWGRVWCGWACPQTVFIERVYRKIEILIQGNYIERRKLLTRDWQFLDYFRAGLKWFAYLIFSSIFAHSFVAYWIGSSPLIAMVQAGPFSNISYFVLVSGMTALLLFNFGWFREQFCLIACPYGRLQSTMVDSHSINVMYDEKRGEPRKGAVTNGAKGDCVSCFRCVQVCPTGIDIRNGVQMECIGCTACMDACDDIMQKVNKPKGLIRYKALTDKKVRWFRPRVLGYLAAFSLASIALITTLILHSSLRIEVLRAKDQPYQLIQNEAQVPFVRNHFILRLENKGHEENILKVEVLNDHKMVLPENPIHLNSGEIKNIPFFVETPVDHFDTYGRAYMELSIQGKNESKKTKVPVLGPFKN